MNNFNAAFDEVIGLEGGYSNDPNDAGGETNWGIAKRWHPEVDIKNLTKTEAKDIYWLKYWNPLKLALVINSSVTTEIFEQLINMGLYQAILHVQQSLNLLGLAVSIDGNLGPQTTKALNNLSAVKREAFLKCMNGYQFIKYLVIITNDKTQKKFFVGWLRRI